MAKAITRTICSIEILHYCVSKSNFLKFSKQYKSLTRNFSSALYMPGNRAAETFSYFSPYLDFDERFENINKLKENLAKRGMNVNVEAMKDTWEFYKNLEEKKTALGEKSKKLGSQLKELHNIEQRSPAKEEEFRALVMQLKILKQDIKAMQNAVWEMEDDIIVRALKLPNELDKQTPIKEQVILDSFGEVKSLPANKRKSHMGIGKDLGLLDYRNPVHYFLCNEAASFELGLLNLVGKSLDADGMVRISGLDFARSNVVEGSGLDHEDPAATFVLGNFTEPDKNTINQLHLVGNASLVSFLALHTKNMMDSNCFPLWYYAMGRQYTPFRNSATPVGLFTVCQESVAKVFGMTKNNEECQTQFNSFITATKQLYSNLFGHFRIVKKPALELQVSESMRVAFEMWSQYNEQYVEVGHLSLHGNYFSKRLLIMYETSTGKSFPFIISGTLLSVPRVLACLLEENPDKFTISPAVTKHLPENYTNLY